MIVLSVPLYAQNHRPRPNPDYRTQPDILRGNPNGYLFSLDFSLNETIAPRQSFDLKRAIINELRNRGSRVNIDDLRLSGVSLQAYKVGRQGGAGAALAALIINGYGNCLYDGRRYDYNPSHQNLLNPYPNNSARDRWEIEVCGEKSLNFSYISVELEDMGYRPPPRRERGIPIKANWTPTVEPVAVHSDSRILIFESPRNNRQKIVIRSVIAHFGNGVSRRLNELENVTLEPGQRYIHRFQQVRRITSLDVSAESWNRDGELLRLILEEAR
ncbi:MAG: hypothetical protein KDD50_16460, partial [Bdellovibrionales bacterium]|nr:hypothetical protein [Bdellovibrionales bacterium]